MTAAGPKLVFLGDVMLAREFNFVLEEHPPEWVWGDVAPLLTDADGVIANLECPITTHPRPWRLGVTKAFHFRARPWAVDVLRAGNVRAVNLANNHMLDFDRPGLADTLRFLDDGDIAHCGAGLNADDAAEPALLTLGGKRIAIIGATDNVPEFGATAARSGTNFMRILPDSDQALALAARIRTLAKEVDIVILSLHWGPNFRREPPLHFQQFARRMIDAGAAVVHGHSAHIFQRAEPHGDGVILYDTGDTISDYWRFLGYQNLWSLVFTVRFEGNRPASVELAPARIERGQLNRAHGTAAANIRAHYQSLAGSDGDYAADGDLLRLALPSPA